MQVDKIQFGFMPGKGTVEASNGNFSVVFEMQKWTSGRCVKVKRVNPRLGRDFVCGRCKQVDDGLVEPVEELCEEVETVRGFCYLGDKVNASGDCEVHRCNNKSENWVGEVQGM